MYTSNTRKAILFCTYIIHLTISAQVNIDGLKGTLTSGVFYTDKPTEAGIVTPWKLAFSYKHNISTNSEISIQTSSQTGISKGPYIDGFNTEIENFSIDKIKYTKNINASIETCLGFGKIKANILKKGGSQTPLPFSQAMTRMPLTSSDLAWGIQNSARSFNGSYTIGTAIKNISTSTNNNRVYSLFLEAYKETTQGNFWAQYSQNNLVQVIDSNHYLSFGTKKIIGNHGLNATTYIGTEKGFLGFDCGYQRTNIKNIKDSTLGIGYANSKHEQNTIEISLKRKNFHDFDATCSWYLKNPFNDKHFNAFGIKLEYSI